MAMTENMGALFVDFGVPASWGALQATVLFDQPTRNTLGDLVIDEEPAITLNTDTWPGLAHGDAVIVDGAAYHVREISLLDDGRIKRATLRTA
jgi:hypothetical protein